MCTLSWPLSSSSSSATSSAPSSWPGTSSPSRLSHPARSSTQKIISTSTTLVAPPPTSLSPTFVGQKYLHTFLIHTYSYLLSANFLLVINSSLNFILYVMLSPKFQLKVKKMWAAISSRESDVQDTNIFFVTE